MENMVPVDFVQHIVPENFLLETKEEKYAKLFVIIVAKFFIAKTMKENFVRANVLHLV